MNPVGLILTLIEVIVLLVLVALFVKNKIKVTILVACFLILPFLSTAILAKYQPKTKSIRSGPEYVWEKKTDKIHIVADRTDLDGSGFSIGSLRLSWQNDVTATTYCGKTLKDKNGWDGGLKIGGLEELKAAGKEPCNDCRKALIPFLTPGLDELKSLVLPEAKDTKDIIYQ